MKKILVLFGCWTLSYFVIFFLFLTALVFSKNSFSNNKILGATIDLTDNDTEIFSSLPQEMPISENKLGFKDGRAISIKNYLLKYQAPEALLSEVDFLVQKADQYNVDPRLVIAITRKESTFCKNIATLKDGSSSNNCGGLGIYGSTIQKFSTIHDWLDAEIRFLADAYIEHGITDTCEIEKTYTPPSKGKWCAAINYYLAEMQ